MPPCEMIASSHIMWLSHVQFSIGLDGRGSWQEVVGV